MTALNAPAYRISAVQTFADLDNEYRAERIVATGRTERRAAVCDCCNAERECTYDGIIDVCDECDEEMRENPQASEWAQGIVITI